MEEEGMIKFKRTTGEMGVIELAYEAEKTVGEYLQDMQELFDVSSECVKLIFKGRVVNLRLTAAEAKLKEGTVMVVIKQGKKDLMMIGSQEQLVPLVGMNKGFGTQQFGVKDNKSANNPQSTSIPFLNPAKMGEIINDSETQGLINQILNNPAMVRNICNEDPMLSRMMKDHPILTTVIDNPALMKTVFNKDAVNQSRDLRKQESLVRSKEGNAYNSHLSGLFEQMRQTQKSQEMPGNPFNMNIKWFTLAMQTMTENPTLVSQMMETPLAKEMMCEMVFDGQLRQLQFLGFPDRNKNLQVLKQVQGNLQLAIERLCSK